MILIYLCLDERIPKKFVNRCQINPDHSTDTYRTDLQFYVMNYLFRSPKSVIISSFTTT
jgi:hypothetical protein